jgi:hypothetical protein
LEGGHGDAGEGGGGGDFDVFVFGHGEGELEVFEHVLEGEAGFEVAAEHAGEFHIDDAGAGGVLLEGEVEFVEFDAVAVEEGEGFGEGGDLGGGEEVGGDLEDGGLADVADGEDLFGAGGEEGSDGFEGVGVASDVVNELAALGGVATAGEGGVEKGGLAVVDDLGGGEGVAWGDGGVVEDDVGGGEGGGHVADDGEEGVAVGDEDLDVAGGVGDFGGGAEEVGFGAEGAVPEPDLVAGATEAGGDAAADDAEADDAGGGGRRGGWIEGGEGVWLGWVQGKF